MQHGYVRGVGVGGGVCACVHAYVYLCVVALLILSHCLKISRKNGKKMVSPMPSYSILIGYFITGWGGGREGIRLNPLNPLWICLWI